MWRASSPELVFLTFVLPTGITYAIFTVLIARKTERRLNELREMGAEEKFKEMGLELDSLSNLRDINYFYALATRDMLNEEALRAYVKKKKNELRVKSAIISFDDEDEDEEADVAGVPDMLKK